MRLYVIVFCSIVFLASCTEETVVAVPGVEPVNIEHHFSGGVQCTRWTSGEGPITLKNISEQKVIILMNYHRYRRSLYLGPLMLEPGEEEVLSKIRDDHNFDIRDAQNVPQGYFSGRCKLRRAYDPRGDM